MRKTWVITGTAALALLAACGESRKAAPSSTASSASMDKTASYTIRVDKEATQFKVTYDVRVPAGGSSLLSKFHVYVDGVDVVKDQDFRPGNHRIHGTLFHQVKDATLDVTVAFSVAATNGWSASNSEVFKGIRTSDTYTFRN